MKNTNEYSWGDGSLLQFKEDHFIGSTGVRFRRKREEKIEALRAKIQSEQVVRERQIKGGIKLHLKLPC